MVLMCWDFIDFNTTRLSAFAGWTTDDAKGEEEEDNRVVVNIKIAFFSVVLGGKRVVSRAFCRRARVLSLLCSEEERERAFQCNTQDVPVTLATLNTRKREEFYLRMSLLGETLRRNQRREKREPTRETPQNTFVYRGGGGLYFLSFFSLFVVLRSSGIMGFITSAYRVCARAAAARRGACVPRRVLFEASSNVLIGAGAFPVFGDHALRRFHLGGNV